MSRPRILPDAQGLQALADAFPGITQTELAKIIGCNASYLGTALEKAGIELRHGRRTNSQHYTLVQTRKIPPARGKTSRPCISCGSKFCSEGPGNRMCDPCRQGKSTEWPII